MSQANRNVKKAPVKFSALSLEVLREICNSCIAAGAHWRPVIEAVLVDGQWHWRDRKETGRPLNGPFATEQEALIAAASEHGIEREKAELLFGPLEEEINLRACPTAVLLAELKTRGALAGLFGHIGGLYDELQRANLIGKRGYEVVTYRAYCVRREEARLSADETAEKVAASWQKKIDDMDQQAVSPATSA